MREIHHRYGPARMTQALARGHHVSSDHSGPRTRPKTQKSSVACKSRMLATRKNEAAVSCSSPGIVAR